MAHATLSGLNTFPIKSCAPTRLTSTPLSRFGLPHDRRWMLVDENNRFISQREHARMCLLRPRVAEADLRVSAPGRSDLRLTSPPASSRTVTVWGDRCQALDWGDEAADWFSDFLGAPARLVYFPEDGSRQIDTAFARPGEHTAFADAFPYLLISQASLDDLNARLETAVGMDRFRPNLVVSGCDAFAEDAWRRIRIGDVAFRVAKPCSRCSIPGIDPVNGEKDATLLQVLRTYRRREDKIYFGQNLIAESPGELGLGMSVEVLE